MTKILNLFQKFDHYNTIDDMPIFNWLKIQDTNDITWILKEKRSAEKCSEKEIDKLQECLQVMTNEYIDAYGITDEYRRILRLKGEIFTLRAEFAMTQDRTKLTFLAIKQDELMAILLKSKNAEKTDVRVFAMKYLGQSVDMKKTSVREFYNILAEAKKEIKSRPT